MGLLTGGSETAFKGTRQPSREETRSGPSRSAIPQGAGPPLQGPSATHPGPISQYPTGNAIAQGGYNQFPSGQGPSSTHPGPISQYPLGYAEGEDAAQAAYGQQQALAQQALAYLQNQKAMNANTGAQKRESLGLDNRYAGEQKGYAREGAGLAMQLLGIDRGDLGINRNILGIDRADFQRGNALTKWQMENAHAARGAYVTEGHRFQQSDLKEQLRLGNAKFDQQGYLLDNEGRRIGVREDQVDLNLREQLAGYDNRIGQNNIGLKYNDIMLALEGSGIDQQTASAIAELAQTDANMAALIAQYVAAANSGYQYGP